MISSQKKTPLPRGALIRAVPPWFARHAGLVSSVTGLPAVDSFVFAHEAPEPSSRSARRRFSPDPALFGRANCATVSFTAFHFLLYGKNTICQEGLVPWNGADCGRTLSAMEAEGGAGTRENVLRAISYFIGAILENDRLLYFDRVGVYWIKRISLSGKMRCSRRMGKQDDGIPGDCAWGRLEDCVRQRRR